MESATEKQALIKVGITIGDINGIGPEIILKALRDARILKDFTPIIYGSEKVLSHYQALLEMDDFSIQICKNASQALENNVNVVNVWTEEVELSVGQGTEKGVVVVATVDGFRTAPDPVSHTRPSESVATPP